MHSDTLHTGRSRIVRALSATTVLFALVGSAACNESKAASSEGKNEAKAEQKAEAKAPVAAMFAKATTHKAPRELELNGSLVGDQTSEVATQAAGAVTEVKIDLGARVKKGDVLVTLDPRDAQLRLAQANATLQQSYARLGLKPGEKFDAASTPDVRTAKEALDLAQADSERNKGLLASGSITQAQFDPIRSRAEQARSQLDSAMAGALGGWASVAASESAARLAQKQLDDATIRAPFDGSVVDKRVSAGEYATVGKVVAVVVHDDPLRLKIDIPEADIAQIAIGQSVDITVAAFPGKTFAGKVARLSASLTATARTLPIEADVPNGDGTLRAGLFARARIQVPGRDRTVVYVPKAAVGTTGATSRVFVKQGNKVVERLVTVGHTEGDEVEVTGDVAANDEVAVTAVDKLSDGAELAGN